MDTHNSMGKLTACEISRKANSEAGLQGAGTPPLMGSRGARRLTLVVVQGAKALTVSNRRTVGRGYAHFDGSGIQILLDCVPLTGSISVRDKHPRRKEMH